MVATVIVALERLPGFGRKALGISAVREKIVNKLTIFAITIGAASLAACNQGPQEQKADNIEANAEMRADNLEEAADNATTEAGEDALENKADATREAGEVKADQTRNGADADGNSAN